MLGGALGSALRYGLAVWMQGWTGLGFPWWTFTANVLGSLGIGLVMGAFLAGRIGEEARLFLAVGVLGGFTTFSSFSYETLALLQKGEGFRALIYVLGSVATGFFVVLLAFYWARGEA